jgi:lysozyme family protein
VVVRVSDDDILDAILAREGGFVDNPADHGGPTMLGITLATLSEAMGKEATVDDLKALTPSLAKELYRRRYIRDPGYLAITDERLRSVIVDAAVNHGPSAATKMLQRAVGATADGVVGPVTVSLANASEPLKLARLFLAQRLRGYGRIMSTIPADSEFAAGWMNRVAEQLEAVA